MENLLFLGVPILKHIRVIQEKLLWHFHVCFFSQGGKKVKVYLHSVVQRAVGVRGPLYPCSESVTVFIKPTVKILKFGTPQTIAIIVLRIEKFDETLH